jgi:hypothetical protein
VACIAERLGKIASKYRMSIDTVEFNVGDQDQHFFGKHPDNTIEFGVGENPLPLIAVGYNNSDDLDVTKGRDGTTYKFSSGLSLYVPDIQYWENHNYNNTGYIPDFSISVQPHLYFDTDIKLGALKELKKSLDTFKAKKAGRELSEVERLGANKGLPGNIESVIGSFLTGKNGSTKGQMNKLKQNSGIQGPPRAGGGKKTRKGRK